MSKPFRERKFLLCTGQAVLVDELVKFPKSHIIGEMRYVTTHHHDKLVTSLAVYESSMHVTQMPALLPEIRMYVVGDAFHIKCTLCRHRRRWDIGRAALLQLMARYGKIAA